MNKNTVAEIFEKMTSCCGIKNKIFFFFVNSTQKHSVEERNKNLQIGKTKKLGQPTGRDINISQ